MLRVLRSSALIESVFLKTFSGSAISSKQYVIKDHYDFDQKVSYSDTFIIDSIDFPVY